MNKQSHFTATGAENPSFGYFYQANFIQGGDALKDETFWIQPALKLFKLCLCVFTVVFEQGGHTQTSQAAGKQTWRRYMLENRITLYCFPPPAWVRGSSHNITGSQRAKRVCNLAHATNRHTSAAWQGDKPQLTKRRLWRGESRPPAPPWVSGGGDLQLLHTSERRQCVRWGG